MKRISKKNNKKAFTLVEMMLAIAIIMLIGSLFVSLVVSIRDSYYKSFNANDATDYASLYASAFEKFVLSDISMGRLNNTYSVNGTTSMFMIGGTPAFPQLTQIRGQSNGGVKWNIYFNNVYGETDVNAIGHATTDGRSGTGNVLHYQIVIVDGVANEFGHPGTIQQIYNGSIYIPHNSNYTITVKNDTATTGVQAHFSNGDAYSITPCYFYLAHNE